MTDTDATNRPLSMPENFLPYLERYRLYPIFKEMIKDLVINLPKDHLKHMKLFLGRRIHTHKETDRIILLISPQLHIDVHKLVKDLIKNLGFIVITRRYILDRYEKPPANSRLIHKRRWFDPYNYMINHDDYVRGTMSLSLLSEVTKSLTMKEPVPQVGWLMFDHPCTVREARYLQQDGVLPTVTLALTPTPSQTTPTYNPLTRHRDFYKQDFEGLKYVYRATLKEVYVDENDDTQMISKKCFNAIRACVSGAQGPGQGIHVGGAPSVYRVVILGPKGSGRRTQSVALAKHFGLVYLHFEDMYNEALARKDEIGGKLRAHGANLELKALVVQRRILQKDCLDHGWVLCGYPQCGNDFERMDLMSTPPNRIIFLNADWATCKARAMSRAVDWCTGLQSNPGTSSRLMQRPQNEEKVVDYELELYFTESLAELRAAAGITAVEVDANQPFEQVQTKIQAAVIATPVFSMECGAQLRDVRVD